MSQEDNTQAAQDIDQRAAARILERLNIFALVRTAFSSERSLLSWMRTCVSLYTFGFTLTKFIDYLGKQQVDIQYSSGLRRLGLALIFVGILVIVLAVVEHVRRLRKMKQLGLPAFSLFPLAVCTAIALLLVGIAALMAIVFNWP